MTNVTNTNQTRKGERGNVLFLILIAVALFAALSYAVTQSTRSGGGDAGRETNLVNSAQITQYPAAVKTSIVRMMVTNGTSAASLLFDAPGTAAFTALAPSSLPVSVFHTAGGQATYQQAPANVMANNLPGTWRFNSKNAVANIGTDHTVANTVAAASADIIAFLPGVTQDICTAINNRLGITGTTADTGILFAAGDDQREANQGIGGTPVSFGDVIGDDTPAGVHGLDGQAQGCFSQGGQLIYYNVIVER